MTTSDKCFRDDARFGFCPECREPNDYLGYLNVEGAHFFVCDLHKVAWPVGWNLFSSWKYENEDVWDKNRATLETCRLVKPAYCECDGCIRDRALSTIPAECDASGELPF